MTSAARSPRADVLGVAGAVLVAAFHVFVIGRLGRGFPGYDVFAYTLPNFLYARDALARGHGLLWNEYQNCGQPFFAIISTALLHPLSWLSFFVDPEAALAWKLFLNLSIGGIGAYALGRELGLSAVAACAAAAAFGLGGGCAFLARTGSFMLGPYVWLPWAALLCERILRAPRPELGIALGIVLTLALFAGFPQIEVFVYQWIGLRVVWELATRRGWPRGRALAVIGLGLALAPLLGAVQLVPAVEMMGESVRGRSLSLVEVAPPRSAFADFRDQLGRRAGSAAYLFPVVAVALAGGALAVPKARRAAFYLLAGGLYLLLAFVPQVFDLYRQLPLGRTFRAPIRFSWMASFALAIAVGCGVEAVARGAAASRSARRVAAGGALAALVSLHLLSPIGFLEWEWGLLAGVLAVAAVAAVRPPPAAVVSLALLGLLAANLYGVSSRPVEGLSHPGRKVPSDAPPERVSTLTRRAWAFELVRRRGSEQDRLYPVGRLFDYSLLPKSASVFGVPSITDYEPQTSQRYAELFVRMLSGAPLSSVNQFYYPRRRLPRSRPLFDLLATRFLVVDSGTGADVAALRPPLRLLAQRETLRIYENPTALPRAFFVPRLEVIPDADRLLERLASPDHRPRRVALVAEPPADGFFGQDGSGPGDAAIEASRGEELVVRVRAPQAGFLFVSDQLYPGWTARVDGTPAPIQRANHAFRLVRVPAGDSTVVFRYQPASLRLGAALSAISLLALLVYGAARGLRARSRTAPINPCARRNSPTTRAKTTWASSLGWGSSS